eukprot:6783287-Prymnesium_polylepis.1
MRLHRRGVACAARHSAGDDPRARRAAVPLSRHCLPAVCDAVGSRAAGRAVAGSEWTHVRRGVGARVGSAAGLHALAHALCRRLGLLPAARPEAALFLGRVPRDAPRAHDLSLLLCYAAPRHRAT